MSSIDISAMKQHRHITLSALACAICCIAIVCGIWRGISCHKETRRIAERKEFLAKFGIDSDGTQEFVSLPRALPHNALAARLGEKLFVDKRLARNPYRVCGACHRLNEGGIDARALDWIVRYMIESPNHCAGDALSNAVVRLAADEKLRTLFQTAYADGLTENNLLDAFGQYQRTLFSSGLPFDHWCAGRTNALTAVQTSGFAIFRQRKCTDCHFGPALGTLKVANGKKVPGLRGLSQRRSYLPDARTDLGAVLTLMPGGDVEPEDRRALTAFLKTL